MNNTDTQQHPDSENENQKQKPNYPQRRPLRRVTVIVISIFAFLLLVVFPILINIYADRIIGRTLSEIVYHETAGDYELKFADVSLNVFNNHITFDSILLMPDSSLRFPDSLPHADYLALSIPKLHLKSASWLQTILHRELIVEDFLIEKPEINLYLNPKLKDSIGDIPGDTAGGFDHKDLHGYINKYIDLLNVDKFLFNRGSLLIRINNEGIVDTLEIRNFTVAINNFHLDSTAHLNQERLFFSDSLGIKIQDGFFRYRGDHHDIGFRHFDISTASGTFLIEDILITNGNHRAAEPGYFSVQIPHILLNGLDYRDVLRNRKLIMNELDIQQPKVLAYPGEHDQQSTISSHQIAEMFFASLSPIFSPVQINSIHISNGSLNLPQLPDSKIEDLSIPDFSFSLYHFLMDSASFSKRSKFFFVDDFVFNSNHQNLAFRENKASISYENLYLDTRINEMTARNLHIEKDEHGQKSSFDVKLPHLKIVSKSFKSDYLNRTLSLNLIEIDDSEISFYGQQRTEPKPEIDPYNLYPAIENILDRVEAEKILLHDANVKYEMSEDQKLTTSFSAYTDISISNFSLKDDSSGIKQVFYSSAIEAQAKRLLLNLVQKNQLLSMDNIEIDTRAATTTISGIKFEASTADQFPETDSVGSQIFQARKLALGGIDFRSLYFREGIFVASANIHAPNIYYTIPPARQKPANSQSEWPDFLLGQISLYDGFLHLTADAKAGEVLQVKKFNISLNNVKPDYEYSNRKVDASAASFNLEEISFVVPAKFQEFRLRQLRVSSIDSTIQITDFGLVDATPINGQTNNAPLKIKIPDVAVSGIPLFGLYHHNELVAQNIQIQDPSTQLYKSNTETSRSFLDFNVEDFKTQMLKTFKLIAVDSLGISDADFRTTNDKDGITNNTHAHGIDLFVQNLRIDSMERMQSNNVLFAKNIQLLVDSILNTNTEKNKRIQVNNIALSTGNNSLNVGSLIFNNLDGRQKEGNEFDLGKMETQGLDYFELLTGKNLTVDKIAITEPNLSIIRKANKKNENSTGKKDINLYDALSAHLHEVKAHEVVIKKAKLKLKDKSPEGENNYLFKQIDFEIKNILIDSSNRVFDNKFLYSDDLNFSIHDFTETSADSLYDFGAALIRFTSSNATINIDSGFVHPNYDDTTFAAKVGVQADRLDFVFDRLQLHNLRVMDFVTENTLWIDKAELDGLEGSDYRNKSYPPPENHFPKLPASALQSLKFTLRVDTFLVHNSSFTYREYVSPALENGNIWFGDINITGRNITNMPEVVDQDSMMRFNAVTKMMNHGDLSLNLAFNIRNTNDHFSANGVLNNFDMTLMNPLLEHIAFVRVTNGYNDMLHFNFTADNDLATGAMNFNYNKLHIRLIDKKSLEDKGSGVSFVSFIANTFVVRRNNPRLVFSFREGDIYFRRDKKKSFFNYLAKSALSGVSSTIRGGNEERKEKRQKKEMERQLKSQGKLDEYYMKELNEKLK